ncbi:MAG: DUF1385 domain-containing protein [Oscillospiraceae bacterium]|nr:DUF1385 domain-containing protein [Oscillospiraceae bacterium]
MSEVNKELYKSKIGGQALIEGVMMSGVKKGAMACRLPNGEIDLEVWDKKPVTAWYRRTPIIRGLFNFGSSMKEGYRCLMKSAEKQMDDEEAEEDEKLSDKAVSAIMSVAMVIGIVIAVGLFVILPKKLVPLIHPLTANRILQSFAEGILKIILFILYLSATLLMKDQRRTYEYHGAEHKTIACLEAGLELNVENVKKQRRFHPRCGTSFIFITLIISILVMCMVPFREPWLRVVSSLILLPVMVGISYELIRIAGRYTNTFTRIISAPGLWIQRLTTREPDASQIETAIAAIKPCIPENLEEDKW